MEVKQQIISALKKAIKALKLSDKNILIHLEHPEDEAHGDYSSNVALMAGKKEGMNPQELAEKIKLKIENLKLTILDKVEATPPGFINFWLSREFLISQLGRVLERGEKYGRGRKFDQKKIMVEFTDPNPFKEFHIGHLYSNAVGESLARLLEAQGGKVKRADYFGDVGLHVAKALWGIMNNELGIVDESLSLVQRVKLLGKAYAMGEKAYEENERIKQEIESLNKKIYEKDSSIWETYQKGRKLSLDYFETIFQRLGTRFDYYYPESEVGQYGVKIVRDHISDGIFTESAGAIVFRAPSLHTRVFINSMGFPTYEAKELGLNWKKFQDYPFDLSIIVTGSEINAYFKVLFAAMQQVIPAVAKRTRHIGHGMVRLPTGKMSSRTGQVLTGEWLLDEAKRRIKEDYEEMDEETAEKVAIGAVKWALLKSGIGKDIAFNFDSSISLQGDSGPYLQYTFARTQSVVGKAGSAWHVARGKDLRATTYELQSEEAILLRTIHRFSEVVEETSQKFAPNLLCGYLFELAQKFNLFYQKHPIIESENSAFRLSLTAAVGQIIKNGLYLLGIEAPERM